MLVKSRTNDNNGLEPILPKEHEFICNQTVNRPKRDYTIVQQGHVFSNRFHTCHLSMARREHHINTFNRKQIRVQFPAHSLQHGIHPTTSHWIANWISEITGRHDITGFESEFEFRRNRIYHQNRQIMITHQ